MTPLSLCQLGFDFQGCLLLPGDMVGHGEMDNREGCYRLFELDGSNDSFPRSSVLDDVGVEDFATEPTMAEHDWAIFYSTAFVTLE